MTKYLLAYGLSYLAALLSFAAMGTVSLFRWPVGPVPAGFRLLWTLIPLAVMFLSGCLCARRWKIAVSQKECLILLAVMAGLFLLAWFVEALQPLTAPGQMLSVLPGLPARGIGAFFLGLAGNLLFPVLFHLGGRV